MIRFPGPTTVTTSVSIAGRKPGQRAQSYWQRGSQALVQNILIFVFLSGCQDTPKHSGQASPARSIMAQCMETHCHLHGKSQPRLLQTYLFMKCEVTKKVLNPTTVLTLTVLSRSVGTQGCHPAGAPLGGDRGLYHSHSPLQVGQQDSTGRGKP